MPVDTLGLPEGSAHIGRDGIIHAVSPCYRNFWTTAFRHQTAARPCTVSASTSFPRPDTAGTQAKARRCPWRSKLLCNPTPSSTKKERGAISWGKTLESSHHSLCPAKLLFPHHCTLFCHLSRPTNTINCTSIMLASSRTALRQAASKQLTLKSGARTVSAWSQIPQGPPVSCRQLLTVNCAMEC